MNIHEHQAKEILKEFGAPVSNGVVVYSLDEVSKKISDACYPISVKMDKNMRDGNLFLNVVHGKELEVEYEKKEIMDKINSFFGYKCISHVTLKIVQNTINKEEKVFPKIKNFYEIDKKMSTVNNSDLKSSLKNFLKAFNERNK